MRSESSIVKPPDREKSGAKKPESEEADTAVTIIPRKEAVHPELIDDPSKAPPPFVIGKLDSIIIREKDPENQKPEITLLETARQSDTNITDLLKTTSRSKKANNWRRNENHVNPLTESFEDQLAKIPAKNESQVLDNGTSAYLPDSLVDTIDHIDGYLPTSPGRRQIIRTAERVGIEKISIQSHPQNLVRISHALGNLRNSLDIRGLRQFEIPVPFKHETETTTRVTFDIDNYVNKNVRKLKDVMGLDKTQIHIFLICAGLCGSETLKGKHRMDMVEKVLDDGREAVDEGFEMGKRNYRWALEYVASRELSREQVEQFFIAIRETYDQSPQIMPDELVADMWVRAAVFNPVPVEGKGIIKDYQLDTYF